MRNPFRYFNSSPEIIRLAVMMYIRYPLSLRQVEDFARCPSEERVERPVVHLRVVKPVRAQSEHPYGGLVA